MGIDKIAIKGHVILKDQTWPQDGKLNQGLNIITSKNGGGKTSLLRYINEKCDNNENNIVRFISTSISSFRSSLYLNEYRQHSLRGIRPVIYREYSPEYKFISELYDREERGEKLLDDCNKFLKSLSVNIQLESYMINAGRLRFINIQNNAKLSIDEISTGEKTAFILWLITKSEPKPNVLLLDEFDAHISGINDNLVNGDITSVFIRFFQTIIDEFVNKGVQVFLATNRIIPQDLDRYYKNLNDLMQEWKIYDGKIQPK